MAPREGGAPYFATHAVLREIDRVQAEIESLLAAGAIRFGEVVALAAVFVARGAAWARIVATTTAGLTFLGGISVVGQPAALVTVTGIAVAVVALVAIVLLWLPSSSRFFRARKASQ